jgi:hypothetical protein
MPGGDARPCRPWLRFYSATADAGSVAPWAVSRAARSLTNRRPVPGRVGRLSAAPLLSRLRSVEVGESLLSVSSTSQMWVTLWTSSPDNSGLLPGALSS